MAVAGPVIGSVGAAGQVAPVVEGHQVSRDSCTASWSGEVAGGAARPGRSTRRRRRPAGCRRTPASAGSSRSPRRWPPAPGPGPAQHGLGATPRARRRTGGRRRPAGSRRPRRAGRGGRRGPPSGRRPRGGRRPARGTGSARDSRWVRAAARTNAASRSRWTPASSNRSSSASAAIRRVIGSTTSSGRRSRLSRSWRTTAAYVVGVDAAVAGRQAAAHLGQHARRCATAPRRAGRLHWRTGKVSCRAARHFSAALAATRTGRGSRRRRRAPAAPATAAATARGSA